jgi:acyl carrier protein
LTTHDRLASVFMLVLGQEDVQMLQRASCVEWDSFRHVELITEIEEEFDIVLSEEQVAGMSSFADALALCTPDT